MNIYRKIRGGPGGGMNGYVDAEKDLIVAGITRYRHNRPLERCDDLTVLFCSGRSY